VHKSRHILAITAVLALAAALPCIGQDAKASATGFEIRSAVYEAVDGSGKADVTEKVKAMVKDGTLSIRVTNKDLGGDPTPGRVKRLRVEYAVDGKPQVIVVREGGHLEIPPIPPWQSAAKLIPILQSDAPLEKKSDALRQLAITGNKEAIPVIAGLLTDEKLSHMARYALQTNPDPAVDDAFRNALGQVKGNLLVGVINSIGVRRDAKAVEALTQLLRDSDAQVASAAAGALGRIATPDAATALKQAVDGAPKATQPALYDGLLRCADALRSQGKAKDAQAIYDKVRASEAPKPIRAAAVRGAILARGPNGAALLVEQLRSADPTCFDIGLRVALELPGKDVTQALTAELGKLPADRQMMLLRALSKRGDQTALPAFLASAKSGEKDVRLTAIGLLPEMGNAGAVQPLIALTGDPDADIVRAAQGSLATLPGKKTDDAIVAMLDGADTGRRIIAIGLVASRRMKPVIPKLLKAAADPNQEVRLAALKTLEQLGGSAEIAPLLDCLMSAKDRKDMSAAESALSAVAARDENPGRCAQQVIERMAKAAPEQKIALLHVLTAVGGPSALQAVRGAIDDPNAGVHATAIRALGKWQTADAAPVLLDLAKNSADAKDKLLCLRSYIGLAGNSRLLRDRRLTLCKQAETLVQRDEEKKLLLGALGGIASPDAFAIVMPYLDNSATKEEACAAILSIAQKLTHGRRALSKNAATVLAPLKKAAQTTANAHLKKRIDVLLKQAQTKARRR